MFIILAVVLLIALFIVGIVIVLSATAMGQNAGNIAITRNGGVGVWTQICTR
jgi:hypothetical protein